QKMSKSRGNVINPDDIVDELGADAFRLYEMFMGAFDQAIPWSTNGAVGCRRFLDRLWRLQEMLADSDGIRPEMLAQVHACIKKVTEDYERMKFNTAIAAMMSLVNALYASGQVTRGELSVLVQLLNPVAPHITEEIWRNLGHETSLVRHPWPQWDEKALVRDEVEIAIQMNGKVRGRMMVATSLTARDTDALLARQEVQALLAGKTVRKAIYVPGRLLNLVVG
ncbi:MAG TPA: class I tRNA ligase family protein, partial [Candidatus Avichristensenella intestinipullorum]|nr:class I tRNA ligase family protein [Candidatus Avichristensenella intestinipullorum]